MILPTYDDVLAAAERIRPYAVRTPLLQCPELNAAAGGTVLLKPENLQHTGSFKFRGACNRIALVPKAQRAAGVVAFSSGNHALGVAAAAKLFGMGATIVMPADAPRAKMEGTRALGARILTYDRLTEDREAIAARVLAEQGGTLIKPFDDAQIVAGQGTVGLEILADARALGLSPWSFGLFMTANALAGIAISTRLARWSDTHVSRKAVFLISAASGAACPVSASCSWSPRMLSTCCQSFTRGRARPASSAFN